MREIKFKIYDPVNGMGSPFLVSELVSIASFCVSYGEELKNCKWLQYTGLKDKNEVEIYEGDIVKILYGKDNGKCRKVEGNKYAMGGYNPFDDRFLGWNDVEVIGNIYSNPELLEGE